MKTKIVYTVVAFCFSLVLFSQEKDKNELKSKRNATNYVFEGNKLVGEDFASAEMEYRKAISESKSAVAAPYNLAHSYYKEGKLEESLLRHQQAARIATTKEEKHKAYHNIGNILMQNELCKEAVEAFKNALRNNPSDDETRYNLALAKECAKNEDGGGEDEDKKKDEQDQPKEDEQKKDDQGDEKKEDQQEGEDDKKEGEEKEDEDGKPKDEKQKDKDNKGEGDKEKKQQKPKPQPGKLSKQQIKNLLQAMNDKEQKVQEKINAKKQKGAKVKSDKDW